MNFLKYLKRLIPFENKSLSGKSQLSDNIELNDRSERTFYRGDCTGGDGDYSYSYLYYILYNGEEVLHFEVGVYEKGREEQPILIITEPDNPPDAKITVNSFFFRTQDGGKTWNRENI